MRYTLVNMLLALFIPSIFSQPSTDIYLLDIDANEGIISIKNCENITQRKGYDNQPTFDASGSYIYYTSIRDTQSNVLRYDIKKNTHSQLTFTPESEYSPTPLADGTFSTVRVDLEGIQHLWTIRPYPYRAKKIFDEITGIGYHSWLTDNDLALFIVGEPHELHIAQIDLGISVKVAESIGSPLHKVPEQEAVMYMDFTDSSDCRIKTYHLELKTTEDICVCAQDSEYFIIVDEYRILSGSGTRLMMYDKRHKQWKLAVDLSSYKGIDFYRLSLSSDKKKLALVSRMPD